ncbi:AhpD-like protein [Morchella snyderi]|nr:AhpD-like protein [Morchella snyderi]
MSRPAAAALTNKLLQSLHHNPALPAHTFYFLASVAFSALNRPDEIPRVWNYALEHAAIPGSAEEAYVRWELADQGLAAAAAGEGGAGQRTKEVVNGGQRESALVIHRKIREALLKSVVICGLPVTINALTALSTATPPHLHHHALPPATTRRAALTAPPGPLLARGSAFFSTLYGKVTSLVMGNMVHAYDDLGAVAELLYAHVLSNTDVLGARDTSLLVVAGLVPQRVEPQLRGHLKGALANGATQPQVDAVVALAEECCWVAGRGGGGDQGRADVWVPGRDGGAKL